MQNIYVVVDGLRMRLEDALQMDYDYKSVSAQ